MLPRLPVKSKGPLIIAMIFKFKWFLKTQNYYNENRRSRIMGVTNDDIGGQIATFLKK
jgi:hypothetical protein